MKNSNLSILIAAASKLKGMRDEVVFVGGSTVELFITDEAAFAVRETNDVDVLIEAITYSDYVTFAERLKEAGFKEDISENAPICRWVNEGTVLDVMPLDENVLGFANKWYKPAFRSAQKILLGNGIEIRVVRPEYFLLTKIEAFKGRGKGDHYGSHDLEDIVAVIDGRPELYDEIKEAGDDVKAGIAEFIMECLGDQGFMNALPGHLAQGNIDDGRLPILVARLRTIADLG